MRQAKLNPGKCHRGNLAQWAAVAVIFAACLPAPSSAQRGGQKTFSSPEEAAIALVAAARSNGETALLEVLGPDAKQSISSGDPTEDANERAAFVRQYDQMHRFVKEPNGKTVMYVGAENWPVPIPLVNHGNVWYFDTAAGKQEILYRRIGRNEISAIRIGHALVAAQKEYYSQHNEYAHKIFSDEGLHNGLYWKASEGEPQSPIGPLVASAVAEGYAQDRSEAATPYHGYYCHILTRQGKTAAGGAKNYTVNGKMTGGFAFVLYPAEYRSSGVMTFIVNQDDVVYQKDLGAKTGAIAGVMNEYRRDSTWKKAEQVPQEAAAAPKSN